MSLMRRIVKNYLLKPVFLFRELRWQRLFLGLLLFIIIYSIIALAISPSRIAVEVGRPSPKTIYAPREVIDYHTTEKLRDEAAQAVPEVFDSELSVWEEAKEKIDRFFEKARDLVRSEDLSLDEQVEALVEESDSDISTSSLRALLSMEEGELAELQGRVKEILRQVFEQGIKQAGLETARQEVSQEIRALPYSAEVIYAVETLVLPFVQPNMIFNPVATAENREAARQEVEPVRIAQGSLIVSEGETVTEEHLAQLEALGLLGGGRADYWRYAGLFVILALFFLTITLYLAIFVKDIYNNPSLLFLLGLVVIITLVLALGGNYFSGYLTPVAMGVILITVLFNSNLAIILNVFLALMVSLITDNEFNFILTALLGGMVAIFSVARLQQRADLTKAGLYVAVVNTFTIIAIFLFSGDFRLEYDFLREFSIAVLSGIGNGLFSAVMAIGLLPYLESGFALTTPVTLLELANPNRPLLKKLLMEAPGTYHHSIIVGNLAEAAAEAVGADPLLARVGSYYHDIGKIKRPYFFIENQITEDNPHLRISPNLSSLIVRLHVKDGLEMARREKLPLPVQDIIRQHHGTSMISFFYQQALSKEKEGYLEEKDFRYEGPLPQTKEAAIIMLADSVEAAVRSLPRPVAGRVEGIVRKIIKDKLNDGQLDEADLTLKDLDKIGDIFVHILSGIFHGRIEYPEKELKEELEGKDKR